MDGLAINHPFTDGKQCTAFAAADMFLRINGRRLQRAPMQIYADVMPIFGSGTFDVAHLDPWLRGFPLVAATLKRPSLLACRTIRPSPRPCWATDRSLPNTARTHACA